MKTSAKRENLVKKLRSIAAVLLDKHLDDARLQSACSDFKSLLLTITGLSMDDSAGRADIILENGKALGTVWAATCIDDFIRTKRFVSGLAKAIKSQEKFGRKPIHILYAGCGPFATLALPIMLHFSAADVQFSLLEINPLSFEKVKKVIATLGLEPYLKRVELVDASTYRIPKDEAVDILLSETMQRALSEEPQVPIVLNLWRQLSQEALLIPESICLELSILKPNHSEAVPQMRPSISLGTIATLSAEEIIQSNLIQQWENGQTRFWENTFQLSEADIKPPGQLAVLTEIRVFGEERITFNQSGLTTPLILSDLSAFAPQGLCLKCWYEIGNMPGLHYTFMP
ncbi:MAG TPA: hypothetical protein PKA00_06150 [Saprospiraceae bacterium]|nr:hypothetical protein [Saprospiraceae bacterium]HMQ82466.1 hypothetical protein [Saprospiraceae bacterium]